jgi:hypothetical protein
VPDLKTARANLHSARAADFTAKRRLVDARQRLASEAGCSEGMLELVAPAEIAWWSQEVAKAGHEVRFFEGRLAKAEEAARKAVEPSRQASAILCWNPANALPAASATPAINA